MVRVARLPPASNLSSRQISGFLRNHLELGPPSFFLGNNHTARRLLTFLTVWNLRKSVLTFSLFCNPLGPPPKPWAFFFPRRPPFPLDPPRIFPPPDFLLWGFGKGWPLRGPQPFGSPCRLPYVYPPPSSSAGILGLTTPPPPALTPSVRLTSFCIVPHTHSPVGNFRQDSGL